MPSVYRNARAQKEIRHWCRSRIDAWHVPHVRRETATSAGLTSVVTVGPESRDGAPAVVLLPGTNMNAALCLAAAEGLAREHRVVILDLPGQPGLSSGHRPRAGRTAWYGRWLSEILALVVRGRPWWWGIPWAARWRWPAALLIAGRVLLSGAGVARLRTPAPLLAATVPWLLRLRCRERRSCCVICPPRVGGPRAPERVDGSGRAPLPRMPGPCAAAARPPGTVPRGSGAGRYGKVRPVPAPGRSGQAAGHRLGVGLRVVEGAGHLLLDEAPVEVCELVERFCRAHTVR
ncbi:hypothetical protein SVIOM74S_00519 [Streptomyces violarus]